MTTALLIGQFGNYADIVWSDDFTVVSVPPSLGGWTNDPGWRRGAYNWIPHVPGNTNEQGSWSSADFGDSSFRDHNPGADVPFTIVDDVDAENGKAIRIAAWIEGTDGQGDPIWRSGLLSARDTRNALSTDRAPASSISRVNGYFECRMKLPTGLGLWPAFWLLSEKNEDGYTVEVDVIEHYGHVPDEFKIRLHSWNSGIASVGEDVTIAGLQGVYRTFGVDCRSTEYVFYADGEEVWRTPRPEYHRTMPLSPIVNLALGPGWPIDQTPDPSYLYVDYVRVWERRPMSVEVQPELWSPIGKPWLVALYDMAEPSSLTLEAGKIAQWNDLSGNGHHATQTVAERRPPYIESDSRANGLSTFGAVDELDHVGLKTPEIDAGAVYITMGYKTGVEGTFEFYPRVFTGNLGSGKWDLSGDANTPNFLDYARSTAYQARVNGGELSQSVLPLPLSVVHVPFIPTRIAPQEFDIGYRESEAGVTWAGAFRRFILTTGDEDLSDRQRLEGWAAHRDGIQSSLVPGHPYREQPPMLVEVQPELWSPIGTAPLVALFDAREGVLDDAGDPALDGSEPAQWLDLSGNDYHLSKADVTRRLTWTASDSRANGLPTMGRPDDNDRHSLDMTTPATIGSYYGVIVYRDGTRSTFVSYPVLLNDTTNNSQSGRRLIGHQNQSTLFDATYSINTVASVNGRAETESILPLPLSVVHAREKNGQQMTGLWSIGGAEYFTARVWGGGAFMVMLTDGTEDQAWIDRAVGWMAHEAGIAASLDAGHPYREQPPMSVEVQPELWSPVGKPYINSMLLADGDVRTIGGATAVDGDLIEHVEDYSGAGNHGTQDVSFGYRTWRASEPHHGGNPAFVETPGETRGWIKLPEMTVGRFYLVASYGDGSETVFTPSHRVIALNGATVRGLSNGSVLQLANDFEVRINGGVTQTDVLPLPFSVVEIEVLQSYTGEPAVLGGLINQSWPSATAVVVSTGDESAEDRDRVVGWLAHRYGIALAPGHPYRDSPP